MKFEFNDGGRSKAGYKGFTGDCVCRAIAIAAELDYQTVYDFLAENNKKQRKSKRQSKSNVGKKTAANGIIVTRKWFKDYMKSLGFEWVPTMGIGTGCTVHLVHGELPNGRLVVSVSKHYTAVIDQVINDIYSPYREVHCTGPKNPGEEHTGWIQYRCVYGYWIKKENEKN